MQYFQFLEALHKKSLSRVYLFYGEEDFLKEEALRKLEEALFSERGVEEKDVFQGGASVSVLNEKLTTMTLLGKPGLVVIKDTRELDEDCRTMLLEYIKSPPSQNYLVVFLSKDDDRKRWCISSRECFFVEFKKFYEGDILAWLIARARNNGKNLAREAAKAFLDRAGPNLALLSHALERVINYSGAKKVIELKDVEDVLVDEKRDAVFDLTDALASQDLPVCLGILKRLFLSLTSPQQIIGLLSWQIRQLYTLKKGGKLKIAPFVLKRLKEEAHKFSEEQLEKCLYGLREADTEIKEGLRNPRLSLELFFFRFLKPQESKT